MEDARAIIPQDSSAEAEIIRRDNIGMCVDTDGGILKTQFPTA